MSYELRAGEALGDGVRRICRRQISLALEANKSARTAANSPVHRTRKHLKKARAALRFLAPVVTAREFARAHNGLRKAARLLSDIRDAEVRFQTMQQLGQLLHIEKDDVLEQAEAFLGLELESFLAGFSDWKKEVDRLLSAARSQSKEWPVESLTCKQLRRSAQTAYRRGRRALRLAQRQPTSENFHTVRKRAKELMYQLRILQPLHPALFHQLVSELQVLTENLGNAHDLAFLEQRLIKRSRKGKDDPAAKALSELIGLREKELQRTAAALGERFYAEKPKAFARRVSEFFDGWETQPDGHVAAVKQIARSRVQLNGH
ncbi:MAG: CHAD domain-containing protein [Verrucomicrobiota bacterium]|nr:CHAD domain-containing protein [Verrucomicrobiota bacterium]